MLVFWYCQLVFFDYMLLFSWCVSIFVCSSSSIKDTDLTVEYLIGHTVLLGYINPERCIPAERAVKHVL